jgi:hypothetical protein
MMKTLTVFMVMLLAVFATAAAQEPRTTMTAKRAAAPVTIDGKLDEPVWQEAPAYALDLADDADGGPLEEKGEAKLAWDDEYLYVAIRYEDSDVVAEGKARNEKHFELGDLAEVFVKPAHNTLYWELYATPHSLTSTFFFPSWARSLPSCFEYEMDIAVAGRVEGTLNDWTDRDTAWTAEMAIPIGELEKYGDDFDEDDWTILVARYNYGRYRTKEGPELTMTPRLPKTDYHLHTSYARLKLEK